MFGPLPIPPSTSQTKTVFPHNISFRTADWVNKGIVEDTELYDVVLAFSVSKWVHLNDGDAGIVHFFSRAYDTLRPGGVFILEPQEIESYAKAKRMDPKLKEVAKSLTLKPSPDFERILVELGFERPERLGSTGKGGFHRPVNMYRKPPTL